MEAKKDWDFANILTKDELLCYLKERCFFGAPDKYEVEFFKWLTRTIKRGTGSTKSRKKTTGFSMNPKNAPEENKCPFY